MNESDARKEIQPTENCNHDCAVTADCLFVVRLTARQHYLGYSAKNTYKCKIIFELKSKMQS